MELPSTLRRKALGALGLALLLLGSAVSNVTAQGKAARGGKGAPSFVQPVLSAAQAVEAAQKHAPQLKAGPAWIKTGRRGDARLEVALTLSHQVVGRVGVHPGTGELLPKGSPGLVGTTGIPSGAQPLTPAQAMEQVTRVWPQVTVGPGAWLAARGEAWHVPVVWQAGVLLDLRVDSRTGMLLPDLRAARDAIVFAGAGLVSPPPSTPTVSPR